MSTTTPTKTTVAPRGLASIVWRWRVVDIVVASVVGVASGLIFAAWSIGYHGPKMLLEPFLPGLQGLLDGPWLFAGVLGALIIRKPGAAIYVEVVAATVSGLLGTEWGGFLTIEAGLVQGLGAELIFLLFFYKRWTLPVAVLAGAGAGILGALNNMLLWFAGSDTTFTVVYLLSSTLSGAVIAGGLSWVLARGIAATGALNWFASGRTVERV